MSSIRRKQKSGSSQGRGGNTQQEQATYGKVNTREILLQSASRRMRSRQVRENDYHEIAQCKGENGGQLLKPKVERTGGFKDFSQSVDAVLAEVMSRNAPHLWDKQLLDVLKQYDDKDNRKSIYLYRKAMARLKTMLQNSEHNRGTRMILWKTLQSYERRLDEALGLQTSTPVSSDDEDSDEFIEDQCALTIINPPASYEAQTEKQLICPKPEGQHGNLPALSMISEEVYKNRTLNKEKEQKVEDTINSVETPKNTKKRIKADQVTDVDDKASDITTRKNLKNQKNPKDKEEAEPWRKQEAQLRKEEIEIPKPAASMSTPYQCHPAVEVPIKDLQNTSPEPLTIPCSIIKNPSTLSTTEHGTSSVLCCDGKSLEKSGFSTSQLVANDSIELRAAVSLDGELRSERISEESLDDIAALDNEQTPDITSRRDEKEWETKPIREKARNYEKVVREKPPRVRKDIQGKLLDRHQDITSDIEWANHWKERAAELKAAEKEWELTLEEAEQLLKEDSQSKWATKPNDEGMIVKVKKDPPLSRSHVSWLGAIRSGESRASVLKEEREKLQAEKPCRWQMWKHEGIKGGMEQPKESTPSQKLQNKLQQAAADVKLEPRETALLKFEKLTSPIVNTIKKGIKRKIMTSRQNVMQDEDERPTKMQAAVREVSQPRFPTEDQERAQATITTSTNNPSTCTSTIKITPLSTSPDSPPSSVKVQNCTEKMDTEYQENSTQKSTTLQTSEITKLAANSEVKNDGKPRKTNWEQKEAPPWIYNLGETVYRRGLENLGNSCWLNSLLQCLIRSQWFLETFLKPREERPNSLVGDSIQRFIKTMTDTAPNDTGEVWNPQTLYDTLAKIPNWEVLQLRLQQDPTEMLDWMLQYMDLYPKRMSKDGKHTLGHDDSILKEASALFTGKLRQSIFCTKCKITTVKDEPFTLHPVSLDAPKSACTATIEELLQRTANAELLEEGNRFACTTCNEKVLAVKRHIISTLPKILLLHIKRFSEVYGNGVKRTDRVRFGRVLQLEKNSATMATVPSYKLKGVIVHRSKYSKTDPTSGHYSAYVLHGDGWLKCSDHNVTKVQWDTVKTQQAYLLFYEQIGLTKPLEPPQKKKMKLSKNSPLITDIKDINPTKPKDRTMGEKAQSQNKEKERKNAEGKNYTNEVTALRRTLERLLSKVDNLEDQVQRLQESNLDLKLKVAAITRKADMDEEEVVAWRTGDDLLMRAVEGDSPTPVTTRAEKDIDNWGEIRSEKGYHGNTGQPEKNAPRRNSIDQIESTKNRRLTEPWVPKGDDGRPKRRRELNKPTNNNEVSWMETDENVRERKEDQYDKQSRIWWEYKDYLQQSYEKHIGLPLHRKQDTSIYSYTEHRVARGYQRVVTTCQGMYYELTKEQVVWNKVPKRSVTIGGDTCWRGEGVTVYKPHNDRGRRPLVRHRFAINLTETVARTKLRTDRYYIHVYQTKIGPDRRTLRSKEMVRELQRRFKTTYWPREVDTQGRWQGRTAAERREPKRVRDHRRTGDLRWNTRRTNSPSDERLKGSTQRETEKSQMREVMVGLQRLTAAVERMVDGRGGHL